MSSHDTRDQNDHIVPECPDGTPRDCAASGSDASNFKDNTDNSASGADHGNTAKDTDQEEAEAVNRFMTVGCGCKSGPTNTQCSELFGKTTLEEQRNMYVDF
jgi:hypothetical protein